MNEIRSNRLTTQTPLSQISDNSREEGFNTKGTSPNQLNARPISAKKVDGNVTSAAFNDELFFADEQVVLKTPDAPDFSKILLDRANAVAARAAANAESIKTSAYSYAQEVSKRYDDLFSDSSNDLENIQDRIIKQAERLKQLQEEARKILQDPNSFNFEPNPLSLLDNPAYNFKFFITREDVLVDELPYSDQIIIAETGSTGYIIQDVNINAITGPSQFTRNTLATQIKFSILEPHGNVLFDRIRSAAITLGIDDHRRCPLWLELSFKGYLGDDEIVGQSSNRPKLLDDETRVWKLTVKNVEVEIEQGGTRYMFDTVPWDEDSFNDASRRIEKDSHIDASTLGEFFSKLAAEMNDYNHYNVGENTEDVVGRIRKYKFFPPKDSRFSNFLSWKIRDDNATGTRRSESFNSITIQSTNSDSTKSRITFSSGTPIEAIVQEVIGSTKDGQKWAIFGGKSEPDRVGERTERDPQTPAIVFYVEAVRNILSYNQQAKNYITEISYYIVPYETYMPIISRKQLETSTAKGNSTLRLASMLNATNIKKKYEYLYTGLNTEVLEYKIVFNRAWHLSLPIFRGQNRSPVASSSSIMTSEVKKQYQIREEKVSSSELLGVLNRRLNAQQEALNDIIDSGASDQIIIEGSRILNETRENIREVERAIEFEDRLASAVQFGNIENELQNSITTTAFGRLSSQQFIRRFPTADTISNTNFFTPTDPRTAQSFRRNVTPNILTNSRGGSIFFVEDFANISVGLNSTTADPNSTLRIVGTEISPTISPYQGNIEGTAPYGRSYFSAVMNQVYGNQGQMINLDLEIRGDPYWLGEPDAAKRIDNQINKKNEKVLTSSDSQLILILNFPEEFDAGQDGDGPNSSQYGHAGTGLVKLRPKENGFNGVYNVVTVESNFSNGRFTQKLTGFMDYLVQEQDVLNIVRNVKEK